MENEFPESAEALSVNDGGRGFLVELGQRVRRLRGVRGMSRKSLAQVSGISERYLAQLESGTGNLSIVLLRRVADAIGSPVGELVTDGEETPDWPLFRELLQCAAPDDLERVKRFLTGDRSGLDLTGPRAVVSRVALIGMRGAGKRTLGRAVADRLGWPFIEMKLEVEALAGLPMAEIFRLYGLEGHRRFEQKALAAITGRPGPMVVATTGGIVADALAFERLLSSFLTIWIKARPEDYMQRVRDQGESYPLQGGDCGAFDELRTILTSREPLYARARTSVDTGGLQVGECADTLFRVIERYCEAHCPWINTVTRR